MTRRSVAAAALALLAAGCAHVTTSEKDATIWMDGRAVGRSGWVWALGPPHTARVVVVARDGRRAHALVEREFTSRTFEGGFYTMGICFLFCWTYPDTYVALPVPRPRASSWDDEEWDAAWLAPPGTATPSPSPTRTPTSTGTSTTTRTPTSTDTSTTTPSSTATGVGSDRFGPWWRH